MITNPKHVSEGRVKFVLTSGARLDAIVGCNDPHGEVFWLMYDGGGFTVPLPYADVAGASIPLNQRKTP